MTYLEKNICYILNIQEVNDIYRNSINQWEKNSSTKEWRGKFSLVAQSCPTLCDPHEPQHSRPPCPSSTPGVYPNSCPLSRWCYPTISSSVISFSSCCQYFPTSGSFPMSQLLESGGQSIGVSASTSVLPMNTQGWSPLGWTSWISLQSKELSRVFSDTKASILQCSAFFIVQLSRGKLRKGKYLNPVASKQY